MSSKLVALLLATTLLCAGAAHADTLATIKARGMVLCGASAAGTPGFSATGTKAGWAGMGADYCRALAAAIFNDPSKVRFVTLDPANRVGAVVSGQVDALGDLVPWTLSADTDEGVRFVGTLFYDGQGFLAPKAVAMNSARDLGGREVCVDGEGGGARPRGGLFRCQQHIRQAAWRGESDRRHCGLRRRQLRRADRAAVGPRQASALASRQPATMCYCPI